MPLYLVRHAKAGDRSSWPGEDRVRPLTAKGKEQSDALAERFAGLGPARLLSSPYLRCVQTLEPLAHRWHTAVEATPMLEEGAGFEAVLDALATLPEHSVLCSHGDVIPDVIGALARRGAELVGAPNWKKASVWVLTRTADGVRRMEATPPPGTT